MLCQAKGASQGRSSRLGAALSPQICESRARAAYISSNKSCARTNWQRWPFCKAFNNSPQASPVLPDRKSTRLNSSHRCISYAVFCLKKKKKKTTQDTVTRKRVTWYWLWTSEYET